MKKIQILLSLSAMLALLPACGPTVVPQIQQIQPRPMAFRAPLQVQSSVRSDHTLKTVAKRMRELTFFKLDADRDGRLLHSELPVSAADFGSIDTNADGMITLEEFHAGKGKMPQTIDMHYLRQHAQMLWTEANSDQNDVLIFNEVKKVLKSLQGPHLSPEEQERQARLVFMLADKDDNASLSFSEFEDAIAQITLNDHMANPIQSP